MMWNGKNEFKKYSESDFTEEKEFELFMNLTRYDINV